MEFLNRNYIQTTTSVVVNSNTTTVENLLLRDIRFQYISDGFSNDATISTMRINFDETLSVSRIALVGHNLKSFTIFYNGLTANTFSLTSTGSTISSDFSTNSETSIYLSATPVDCTSVSIDMKSTILPNQDKAIGYLVISRVLSNLGGRVPSAQRYKPLIRPKEYLHELSDGSFRKQVIEEKHSANIQLDFVTESTRDEIKTVFDLHEDFIFVAFPTTTSWDKIIFPCIWTGDFNFYEATDNAISAGFVGTMKLLETRP